MVNLGLQRTQQNDLRPHINVHIFFTKIRIKNKKLGIITGRMCKGIYHIKLYTPLHTCAENIRALNIVRA